MLERASSSVRFAPIAAPHARRGEASSVSAQLGHRVGYVDRLAGFHLLDALVEGPAVV
jgi:hypothetical protein